MKTLVWLIDWCLLVLVLVLVLVLTCGCACAGACTCACACACASCVVWFDAAALHGHGGGDTGAAARGNQVVLTLKKDLAVSDRPWDRLEYGKGGSWGAYGT
jgi:hypothetical protein